MAKALDPLPSIYDTVRSYIEKVGTHIGYNIEDFDAIYASFRDEPEREDFLQVLYDYLPKDA